MRVAQRAGWRQGPRLRAERRAGLSSKLAPPRRVVARARRSRAAAARIAAGTGVAGPRPSASVTRSYQLLNSTGTLVSYSIASKIDDTSPVLPVFLWLLAKLAIWNYLPTRKHASFYNVWAGAGKPGSAKREAFRARLRTD